MKTMFNHSHNGNNYGQINNIKIVWSPIYKRFQCISPSKKILEEFRELDDAQSWANTTYDFVIRKKNDVRRNKKTTM